MRKTRECILRRLLTGALVHADETGIPLKDRRGYVWVFTSMREVAYYYSDTRDGDLLCEKLKGFNGVLVSDFYPAYDSLPCAQQECLLHLMRDLNEAVLSSPFDEELKALATDFGGLLRDIRKHNRPLRPETEIPRQAYGGC
ncbi:MAG: IS66 family transposase [Gammaproteobacteria bacterium]